nr:aldose epimerase family protein [uncultured Niameybacter sp.]
MEIKIQDLTLKNTNCKQITLINNNGMEVEFLSLGGIITKILVPDYEGNLENVVLAYKNLEDYLENPSYFGALIGRTGGRIYKGQVTINDHLYQLNTTDNGHTLHGGIHGFDKKNWTIEPFKDLSHVGVHLHTISEAGEEGYPGRLHLTVTYILHEDNTFEISYYGICDEDTLLNLTNHTYFNLSGFAKRKITEEILFVNSQQVLALDEENIPTGELLDVSTYTALDFNTPKIIGTSIHDDLFKPQRGYDYAWLLNDNTTTHASLHDPVSKRFLEISTTQPAIVIYTMNFADGLTLENGQPSTPHYSICFETQAPPIGYNECFKDLSLLRKDTPYQHTTKLKFSVRD